MVNGRNSWIHNLFKFLFPCLLATNKERKMSYFKTDEFTCPCCGKVIVSGYLIHKLNNMREAFGKPIYVNSGYRCKERNIDVGGSLNSAHCRGTAADIKCDNSTDRYILVRLALELGFDRIGVYETWIHLDVDEELPKPRLWTK